MSLAPDDKSIRGKYSLINGFLDAASEPQTDARYDFEEASAALLPHSPDPHLGLALIQMSQGNLDEAEDELNQGQAQRFPAGPPGTERPGRWIPASRGERWLAEAHRAHDIAQMQDSLKHADSDLAHAQELYNSVAPFLNGVQMAEKVSLERDKAAKTLAQAEQASTDPVPVR